MFMFQKGNEILTINAVDTIAAKFWGKEVSNHRYATPSSDGFSVNWFDILGHAIEDLQYGNSHYDGKNHFVWAIKRDEAVFSMPTVASMIIFQFTRNEDSAEHTLEMTKLLEPYIKLCYHLHSLGVTAIAEGW